MDKREQLLEKIEKEYETFLEELEDYDVDNIVDSAQYIYLMTEVRYNIREGYVLEDEEDIDYFLKLDKPLNAICDWYEPNNTDLCEDLDRVITEIRENEMYLDEDIQENEGMTMQ